MYNCILLPPTPRTETSRAGKYTRMQSITHREIDNNNIIYSWRGDGIGQSRRWLTHIISGYRTHTVHQRAVRTWVCARHGRIYYDVFPMALLRAGPLVRRRTRVRILPYTHKPTRSISISHCRRLFSRSPVTSYRHSCVRGEQTIQNKTG